VSWTAGNRHQLTLDSRAKSSYDAFTALNYTLLFSYGAMDTLLIYQYLPELVRVIIWEGSILDDCVRRNEDNYLDTEPHFAPGQWQVGKKGCIKKPGFENGIPLWKSFSFHYWAGSAHFMGSRWTLSPENYGGDDPNGNFYLGKYPVDRCALS